MKGTGESEKGDKVPLHQSRKDSTIISTVAQSAFLPSPKSYQRLVVLPFGFALDLFLQLNGRNLQN